VWHPVLVHLRATLGLPRHPAQVVVSASGALRAEDLMFNVPEVPVFLVTTDGGAPRLASILERRPWVRAVSAGESLDLRAALSRLRREYGVRTVSAIGGRTLATSLLDAGAVADLYLTTGAAAGGEPNTPFYAGRGFERALCVRKALGAPGSEVVFEHFVVGASG
jgi:riboflavin biosynthesis pyrimidine reductase